uniref:Uncharacterized protein n=1 Tax=Arundo donax TaxID=35708 RepID=A0A0A9EBA4_ARUDO
MTRIHARNSLRRKLNIRVDSKSPIAKLYICIANLHQQCQPIVQ